jgi:ABC-type nitrate/sulfonate/bicarbonate transport system substrate-binding protein
MTRKIVFSLAVLSVGVSSIATGAAAQTTDITLRLPWLLNVQAAGYVMAEERGFYQDAGLNVEILPTSTPRRWSLRAPTLSAPMTSTVLSSGRTREWTWSW